ncbi:hypothetical protein BBJ29_009951 [Phytophthora kernoviae]|uniref:Uncharacterized protein n=1 Tax=Phytophthora kernoviae TaxID=325452 RepID=A0A421G745_9STRA|nr:hypothetical protein BBJ29_009951 [Phytophthora kernoviae]
MQSQPSQDIYLEIADEYPLDLVAESSIDKGYDVAAPSANSYQAWLQGDGDEAEPSCERGKPSKNKGREASADKKRKTTYDIRKEKKVKLTAKVEKMQKQLNELKYGVLVQQGEAAESNERVAAGNSVLQEFIQERHVGLANLQAMLATHAQQNIHSLHPVHTIIRLGHDRDERHKTLASLKTRKLHEAMRFITARSRGLDPWSANAQEEWNNAPGGDFCLTVFEQTPIIGASARDVYNAFIDVSHNAEIIISEMFGTITIRENNEFDESEVAQMRLVTSTSQGNVVESNSVLFSEFVEGATDKDESYGIAVADFVDSDELYPYRPEERVRRDTTTIFMVRSYMEAVPPPQDSAHNSSKTAKKAKTEGKRKVVVGSRWTCSKVRRSNLNVSMDVMREMQESAVSFGDTMKTCIQQRLGKAQIWEVPDE